MNLCPDGQCGLCLFSVHYGFICPECKAEFANSDLLNKHFSDKHMEQEDDDEPAPPTHRGNCFDQGLRTYVHDIDAANS